MSVFDEPKIDTHCHLFDPARFPYGANTPYRPAGQEIATLEQMNAVFTAYGVQRALLVQPNSGYDTDLSCMLAAIDANPGRFKGIAVVKLDISTADLAALKARGIIGVAFNASFFGTDYYVQGARSLLEKLAALDMALQLQWEKGQFLALLPLLRDFPGRILLDHCGRPEIEAGLHAPAFQAMLDFGRTGRAWVKLSGYAKFSREPWPHRDAWPFIAALRDAFGSNRLLWASDWPFIRAEQRVDYGPLVKLVAMLGPDPADRARLFQTNAADLLEFTHAA